MSSFALISSGATGRTGMLHTAHGDVPTPFFMPIGTKGVVKSLSVSDLHQLGTKIILSNTYHLMLRPGAEALVQYGGLHGLMGWDGALLTDSGGFQIFSLGRRSGGGELRRPMVTEDGVSFQSPLDGSMHTLTPESAVQMQLAIGSDIMMQLDHLVGYPAEYGEVKSAMERSLRWAERCLVELKKYRARLSEGVGAPLLFGIVQGGVHADLRRASAEALMAMDLDGYAIGGLAVGEPEEDMLRVVEEVVRYLPADKPRYLMGVGYPAQIRACVARGVDMFDCVIPTREARHGRLYLGTNGETALIRNERWKYHQQPLNPDSRFIELREHTWAYLRHLFIIGDPLALRLATLHNLEQYISLMEELRK